MTAESTVTVPPVTIDQKLCIACGLCSTVCPRRVLVTTRDREKKTAQTVEVADRLDLCLGCGQCVAVCPEGAVSVRGLAADAFDPAPKDIPGADELMTLLATRRTVRRYRDKQVPRELLERVVQGVALAPPAEGRNETGVIIVQDAQMRQLISERAYELYAKLDKGLHNPIGRLVIRHKIGEAMVEQLERFVLPGVRWYAKWFQAGEGDELQRDAPVVMLITEPKGKAIAGEDALLAAYHAALMAHALGLGACVNGLIPPACERDAQLREALGIADDREVLASITLGYPRVKYRKTIRRKLREVRWL